MASEHVDELIQTDHIALEGTTTVQETIEEIRTHTPDRETTVYYVYVVGPDGELTGVVSMRDLLNAADDTPLSEIAESDVVTIQSGISAEDAMTTFAEQRFNALPVVDSDGHLEGIVRAQNLIDSLDADTTKRVLRNSQSYGWFGD
ncbi:MAG: CBS domain-containing protein [Natronomonas sp.]